jgi:hypothetical protein
MGTSWYFEGAVIQQWSGIEARQIILNQFPGRVFLKIPHPRRRKTMGRLQEQMKADLFLKRYSPNTPRAYLRCVRDFDKFFIRRAAEMGCFDGLFLLG